MKQFETVKKLMIRNIRIGYQAVTGFIFKNTQTPSTTPNINPINWKAVDWVFCFREVPSFRFHTIKSLKESGINQKCCG